MTGEGCLDDERRQLFRLNATLAAGGKVHCQQREVGREEGMEGRKEEGGREDWRVGGREGGREEGMEGRKEEGGRKDWREGERNRGGREGTRERKELREGWREGEVNFNIPSFLLKVFLFWCFTSGCHTVCGLD